MSFSKSEYDATFGTAWHAGGERIKLLLTYITHAGVPTNVVTPDFIGQECLDTANGHWYKSHGLLPANWTKLTN